MRVEPLLQVRLRPSLVQPVARVGSSLTKRLGDSRVVTASFGKEGVPLVGLRDCKRVLV